MRNLVIVTILGSLLLLTGCTEPSFNPNSKRIEFINGKPYRLPYGVVRLEYPLTNSAKDKKTIARFRGYGLDCKYGQQPWLAESKQKEVPLKSKFSKEEYKNQKAIFYRTAIQESKMGCSRPLTDREYNFYHNEEVQDAADRRAAANRTAAYLAAAENARAARKNLQAAQTAKEVNVNVSGTVNHDVYHSGTVNHNVSYYKPYGY